MPLRRDTELSQFIDNAAFARHLKNNDFAAKVNADPANVSRWRRGLLLPPMERLPLIAKVLKIDMEKLTQLWRKQKYPTRDRETLSEVAQKPSKLKVRLLLHFYDGNRFLGQTLPEVEVNDCEDLQRVVIEVYPGTKHNLYGIPTRASSVPTLLTLPSLREGYGPDTFVKVMQIVLLPT
ncbi:MAG: hypothetical protein UX89_C0018G0017 [Parcubacteria group bacterium GW2011_GWA2_47_16]|nr:MAG: hypothetical protein UX89_C0018G0017 [Parcubacteria group bacterium GW2011_GWA2_47_16]